MHCLKWCWEVQSFCVDFESKHISMRSLPFCCERLGYALFNSWQDDVLWSFSGDSSCVDHLGAHQELAQAREWLKAVCLAGAPCQLVLGYWQMCSVWLNRQVSCLTELLPTKALLSSHLEEEHSNGISNTEKAKHNGVCFICPELISIPPSLLTHYHYPSMPDWFSQSKLHSESNSVLIAPMIWEVNSLETRNPKTSHTIAPGSSEHCLFQNYVRVDLEASCAVCLSSSGTLIFFSN